MTIPSERGALGHSDADVVCHAVTDAILGAAGLGDIGRHFPDTDPRWKDASSLDLLRARGRAGRASAASRSATSTSPSILERPKLRDLRRRDARGASPRRSASTSTRVSIKGKTNEGVDAVGRGEAIAAHAVALLRAERSEPTESA